MAGLTLNLMIGSSISVPVQLNSADADSLRATLNTSPRATAAVASLVARGTATQYSGFVSNNLHVRIWLGLAFFDNGNVSSVPGLEDWIFQRIPASTLPPPRLARLSSIFTIPRPPLSPTAPTFSTQDWSGGELAARCYPYALNLHGKPNIFPGSKVQPPPPLTNCASTVAACVDDGLNIWIPPDLPAGDGHFVALFSVPVGLFDPEEPFHFMRLDRSGIWSEKTAGAAPENEDNGKPIVDPRLYLSSDFPFCGFLWASQAARRALDVSQQHR